MKKGKIIFGYALMVLSILVAFIFICNRQWLEIDSYAIASDGIVISRNIMIMFFLWGVMFIGHTIVKE